MVNWWGPYRINDGIELFEPYFKFPPNTVKPKDASDLIADHDQKELWVASWANGLYRGWDTTFVSYNKDNSTISNALKTLCFDNNGHLIIGANNGEVYITKPQKESLDVMQILDSRNGLLGNSIEWLEVDKYNRLWIGTNTGLNQLDLNELFQHGKLNIINIDEKEGYKVSNINVSIQDEHGNIWLGTEEYLVRLHIDEITNKKKTSQNIQLQNVEVNGHDLKDIHNTINDLDYNQNYLHFDFNVINLINPEKDQFRYFLDGLDLGWSSFSNVRHVTYPHLPSGKYSFWVEGKNLHTGNQYTPLEINFTIRVPFWKSWWFIVLTILIFSLVIIYYFKYRIDQTKKQEQKKAEISKQLAQLEMKALLGQMNPHFTFNAINSIQNYILDNNVDSALSYLSDFSKIIRQTLENASKEFIYLEEEIEYIERYLKLEQMRFDYQYSQDIVVDPAIDPDNTQVPPMILQPFIENAIKHGLRHKKSRGKLSIQFTIQNTNILFCSIEDNGIGRKASGKINKTIRKNHNGAGMAITKNRIQKLKEVYQSNLFNVNIIDLLTENSRSQGTRVEICLPLFQRL